MRGVSYLHLRMSTASACPYIRRGPTGCANKVAAGASGRDVSPGPAIRTEMDRQETIVSRSVAASPS